MSDLPPISGRASIDTTDFKTALSEMNRDLRVLESGFKAAAAGMGDWTQSTSGLEARIKSLNSEIVIQGNKVEALRGEYERVAAAQGEGSRAAEELQIKLNKEVEALGKMQTELSKNEQALGEMATASDDAAGEIDSLAESTGKSQTALQGLAQLGPALGVGLAAAVAAVTALAVAAAAAGVAIVNMVFDATEAGAELYDLSLKTGISTTRLQELAYVGDQVGTSADTMTSAMARLTRSMSAAQVKADSELGKAFAGLGVSVVDVNGKLRENEVVFADLITALGNVSNESERDALAMQIFGKSAQELNPLIKAGSEEMARLSQEAHDVGAVMSDETVQGLADFQDSLDSLKAGFAGVMGTISGGFLPIFQSIADVLKDVMANPKVQEGIRLLAEKLGALAQRFADFVASDEFDVWIEKVINWFLNDLPGAIDKTVKFWDEDLRPALSVLSTVMSGLIVVLDLFLKGWQAVWWFLKTFILPIFESMKASFEFFGGIWDRLNLGAGWQNLLAGQSGQAAGDQYNVTINNSPQSSGGLLADINLLQMLYGGR